MPLSVIKVSHPSFVSEAQKANLGELFCLVVWDHGKVAVAAELSLKQG